MNPKMVGAQKAMKIASSLFPFKKSTSETIIIENTTKSIMKFITPILFINLLIINLNYNCQSLNISIIKMRI